MKWEGPTKDSTIASSAHSSWWKVAKSNIISCLLKALISLQFAYWLQKVSRHLILISAQAWPLEHSDQSPTHGASFEGHLYQGMAFNSSSHYVASYANLIAGPTSLKVPLILLRLDSREPKFEYVPGDFITQPKWNWEEGNWCLFFFPYPRCASLCPTFCFILRAVKWLGTLSSVVEAGLECTRIAQ